AQEPIRNMVSQDANRLDFAEIIDRARILLVRLPQGLIGSENTALLGSLVTVKLQMAVMSRQRLPTAQRRDFWCYMDEFHHFITASMAEILTGARKYRMGLVLAHHDLRQLDADRDVSGAVLSSCGTRIVFKVADGDARTLESGFVHFDSNDLMNLGIGQALCRVERSECDFNLAVPNSESVDDDSAKETRESVIAASRAAFARPRAEVEAELFLKWQSVTEPAPAPRKPEKAARSGNLETATASEKKSPLVPDLTLDRGISGQATSPPLSEAPLGTQPLPAFGRGSPEHRAIQKSIKECAEKLGFHGTIEKEVLGGAGKVDVSLESDDQKIACEFSMTTEHKHEIGNLQKCLAAGYETVIAIAPQTKQLIELAATVKKSLPDEDVRRIHFCLPSRFNSVLKKLVRPATRSESSVPRSGSYKIKRKYAETSLDKDGSAAEDEFLRTIGRALRGE
ncbi:MAG: type IV secretory system conjugative DNA transfer family protein, partial [Chthoniobacteraceae bacterium]